MLPNCLLILALCGAAPEEDLTCLKPQPGAPEAKAIFYSQLQQEAYAALARRRDAWQQIRTAEQVQSRQKELREFFTR